VLRPPSIPPRRIFDIGPARLNFSVRNGKRWNSWSRGKPNYGTLESTNKMMRSPTKEFLGWTLLGIFALIGFLTTLNWVFDAYDKFVPFEYRTYLIWGFFAVIAGISIIDWIKRRFSEKP